MICCKSSHSLSLQIQPFLIPFHMGLLHSFQELFSSVPQFLSVFSSHFLPIDWMGTMQNEQRTQIKLLSQVGGSRVRKWSGTKQLHEKEFGWAVKLLVRERKNCGEKVIKFQIVVQNCVENVKDEKH